MPSRVVKLCESRSVESGTHIFGPCLPPALPSAGILGWNHVEIPDSKTSASRAVRRVESASCIAPLGSWRVVTLMPFGAFMLQLHSTMVLLSIYVVAVDFSSGCMGGATVKPAKGQTHIEWSSVHCYPRLAVGR